MATRTPPTSVARHVPNVLSGLRLVIAIAFPFVAVPARLALVVAGGFSDFLDGFLARRWNVRSTAGALLDGIADKAFTLSVLFTFATDGLVAWWQLALLLVRDVTVGLIVAFAGIRRDRRAFERMVSRLPGKLTTALVFLWFLAILVAPTAGATRALFAAAAACSVLASADYLLRFAGALRAERAERGASREPNAVRTESERTG